MIDSLVQLGIPKQYAGDIWLLVLFVAISLALVFIVKRKRLGALLFSIYISYVILTFSYFLPDSPATKIAYFGILIFLIFLAMRKFFTFSISGKKIAIWTQSIILSFLTVGMITSLIFSWLPKKEIQEFFSPFSKQLFTSEPFQLAWVVLPLIFLLFIKKNRY